MDISVVIPTYNRAALLPRALDSVLAQTLAPREIIVVDDASTDTTAALLDSHYPQVIHSLQQHAGVSAARNHGIRAARGEWLALLDSDDAWEPTKLARQSTLASPQPGRRVIHCDERWLRCGQPLAQRAWHRKRGGDIFLDCLPRCVISPSAALLHRTVFEAYGLFDESLPACEDYDLWLRICCREPVAFVATPLVVKHGGHDDQLSRLTPALDRFRIQALVKLLDNAPLTSAQRLATCAMLARKIVIVMNGARKRGNHEELEKLEALRCRFNLP